MWQRSFILATENSLFELETVSGPKNKACKFKNKRERTNKRSKHP